MADKIEAYVEANKERFIEEFKVLIRIPSVSAQAEHDGDTQACAEWLVTHFQSLGLEARLVEKGGKPIVRAEAKGKSSRRVARAAGSRPPHEQWYWTPSLRSKQANARCCKHESAISQPGAELPSRQGLLAARYSRIRPATMPDA